MITSSIFDTLQLFTAFSPPFLLHFHIKSDTFLPLSSHDFLTQSQVDLIYVTIFNEQVAEVFFLLFSLLFRSRFCPCNLTYQSRDYICVSC